jgi:O-antigen/teichoic acid export membrane protein
LLKPRNFWHDSLLTLLVSSLVVAANMILAAILSRLLEPVGFGDYLYIRRFASFLIPFTTLSIGVGLTSKIAGTEDPHLRSDYLRQSLLYLMLTAAILAPLSALALKPEWLNIPFPMESVAGSSGKLWIITLFWLVSYGGYVLLYAEYRGRLRIRAANAVNLFANGIAPLAVLGFLLATGTLSLGRFLAGWGGAYAVCYLPILVHAGNPFRNMGKSFPPSKSEPVAYSIPRIPAGLLLTVTALSLPCLLRHNGHDAVHFLSALLTVQAVFHLSEPLSQVFLPGVSRWTGMGETDKIARLASDTVTIVVLTGLVATVQMWIWADLIAIRWFGIGYEGVTTPIRILAPAIVPAFLYAPLRSILDGIDEKAWITHVLTASVAATLAIALGLSATSRLDTGAACALIVFHYVGTSGLLLILIRRRIRFTIRWSLLGEGILLAAALSVVSIVARWIPWRESAALSVVALGSAGIVCGLFFIIWLRIRKPIHFDIQY